MTLTQQFITIALCVAATMATRFLPFLIFRQDRPTPAYVQYLGSALPLAVFGMLVVYCLRKTPILAAPHGLPQALAILVTVLLHKWKGNMLVSIAGGTLAYMVLIRTLFV
jgi:branched-subunit amino acid transport protein AzlD